ncbi:MAG: acyloxyacyl hydrolase [Bacteroidetes bacterium]|nr:acyloxyacyl hydrolase [Bacteroidota bacterium]
MRQTIISILFTAFSLCLFSQNYFFNNIEASYHRGFIAPHNESMPHLYRGWFSSYHISISGKTTGNKDWHQLYRYPYLGIDFSYSGLGYPEVLGDAYSIMPHIKFNFINGKTYRLNARYAVGVGYLTKKYHYTENYRNTAISSNLNLAVNIMFENEFLFKERYNAILGVGFSHFSNGRTNTPNRGLNIPAVKLGFSIDNSKYQQPTNDSTDYKNNRDNDLLILAFGGMAASYPAGSKLSPRAGITSMYSYPVNLKYRIGLGYDFFYYYNNRNLLSHVVEREQEHIQWHINHGLYFAFQMDFGKNAFFLHKGIYIYDKYNFQDNLFYHRVGFRHTFDNNLVFNLSLKTQFFTAQFFELGIGYKVFLND